MFTRSKQGSILGQRQELDRDNAAAALPVPLWAADLRSEIRALGDIMRLREALAVAHRDVERLRIDRDRLIRNLTDERARVRTLEDTVQRMLRAKT